MKPRFISRVGFRRAYTLTEVLVSFSLIVLLSGAILAVVISMTNSFSDTGKKNDLDADFRNLTAKLSKLFASADAVYVYENYKKDDDNTELGAKPTPLNEYGDMVAVCFYGTPGRVDTTRVIQAPTVIRIVGLCRIPTIEGRPGEEGAVYYFDSATDNWGVTFPRADWVNTAANMALLLPSYDRVIQMRLLTQSAKPFGVTDTVPAIFRYTSSSIFLMARLRNGSSASTLWTDCLLPIPTPNL